MSTVQEVVSCVSCVAGCGCFSCGMTVAVAEALREEGRRDVLREIAKLSPCNVSSCTFCCGSYEIQTDTWAHKPDCLWLRAKAAKEPNDIS